MCENLVGRRNFATAHFFDPRALSDKIIRMRQSKLFVKTRREAPKDEVAKNAQLLIRAGYVNKEMAGVYSFLPLGLRVLRKIENIIRAEMNRIGGTEVLLSSFHPKENWVKTGRWESMDDLYKVSDISGREVALGPTHEEIITPIAKSFVASYKDLPFAAYQFQTKFRMELRSKSGVLRGREFIMKDLYSFHASAEDLDQFYEKAKEAYSIIFEKLGIGDRTFVTFASGGTFSKYSHEFQTLTSSGEDIIYVDPKKKLAINKEVFTDEVLRDLNLNRADLKEEKSIEVGNIFNLGTRFSDAFGLTYKNEQGEDKPVLMGCYGIGPTRVLGTIAEILSDDRGIVWPYAVAPFHVHLIHVGEQNGITMKEAELLYEELVKENVEVLFDDRDVRAGEKFADADLIGIPYRVVLSDKTREMGKLEVKKREASEVEYIGKDELLRKLKAHVQ